MQQLDLDAVRFITDNAGHKQAAIIPIELYNELLNLKLSLPEHANNPDNQFSFEVKGVIAFGYPQGSVKKPLFTVTKGSFAIGTEASSLRPGIQKLRDEMLTQGVLVKQGENYEFQQDYQFNSPSMAACLVAGNARSGLDAWLNKAGFSLKACGYGKE